MPVKKLLRWPVVAIIVSLVVMAIISINPFLQLSHFHAAHASGSASITISPSAAQPGAIVQVSGQNFVPNDIVDIYLNEINGPFLASAVADASGNLPATNITVPDENAGQWSVVAAQIKDNMLASAFLTIESSISLSATALYPGETVTLTGKGLPYECIVQLFLDTVSQYGFFSIGAGGNNGDLSVPVAMPKSSITEGEHTLIAEISTGQNNKQTISIPVTFVPRIYWITGIPGMSAQLTGTGFNASETVKVYWGTAKGQLEGTSTTDASGNLAFTFTAPTGLTPGVYPVTVVRAQQKPPQVRAYFQVNAVTIISTPGIHSGQPVKVQLTGFSPDETMNFSWNANGGQALWTYYADPKGALKTTFYPPSAPPGSYMLTAVGSTSGLQAANPLNVGPGVMITAGNPGSSAYVSGGGFTAGETVNVYIQSPAHGEVTVTTDSTGSFNTTLTLPTSYNPTKPDYVYAVSTGGKEHARTAVIFPPATFNSSTGDLYYRQPVTFFGTYFAANEPVSIIWNYQHAGQYTIDTVTADLNGNFTLTLPVPSTPNQSSITIAAVGTISQLTVTIAALNYASIALSPTSGKAGAKITVTGGSFSGASLIYLYLQNTSLPVTITSNTDGTFTGTFKVPTVAGAGNLTLEAVDGLNNITASTLFAYIPTLKVSPAIAKKGDTVTILGTHFGANESIGLYECGGVGYPNAYGSTNFDGSFSTTMQVTGSSGTCTVTAQDYLTGLQVSATFVMEP